MWMTIEEKMKYYRYHCHSPLGLDIERTLSEEQILENYGDEWFEYVKENN